MVTILVVSNDDRIGRYVRSVLGSRGWFVASASDREAALRSSADQEPALVIVDCEVDGAAELVRTFGAKNGGPGVLLLEPPGESDGAFHAFEAGADQILSKPPQAQPLIEAAERVMSIPHQSAGALTADMGEKLSSADIFGEVLLELDASAVEREVPATEIDPEIAPAEEDEPSRKVAVDGSTVAAAEHEIAATEVGLEIAPVVEVEPPVVSAGEEATPATEPPEDTGVVPEEAVPVEIEDGDETAAGDPADADRVEDREESSFTFDPKVLGDDLDEVRLASPVPVSAEAMSEAAVESEPGQEAAAEEPEVESRIESGSASEAGEVAEDEPDADRTEEQRPSAPAAASAMDKPATDGERVRFGQYRLDERIAVGGMAEVWRASMLGMEGFRKTVAIKKILPHLAENSEFVAMFIEEAKLAAQLSHENLVEIYDLGKIGESFFIAMEYVDGKDLRGLLNRLRQRSEPMPIGLALLVAAEVASGLEYAHTREDGRGGALDLVHRDVSPRNVLIGNDGRVRLCDFGVAKAVSSVIQTQIGALKGKLQYMSPEQASGRNVDNRSDIYSLGSVLYEMISGRRLYEEDNEISLLDAARAGNFDDPRKHCPGLPQGVRRILIRALAKKPSARYQSAGSLEQDLRALVRTLEPVPSEQTLSSFVKALFTEPTQAAEQAVVDNASAVMPRLEGPDAVTRSLQARPSMMGGKAVRFWWGVIAGLLAAGLVAALLKLLLSW